MHNKEVLEEKLNTSPFPIPLPYYYLWTDTGSPGNADKKHSNPGNAVREESISTVDLLQHATELFLCAISTVEHSSIHKAFSSFALITVLKLNSYLNTSLFTSAGLSGFTQWIVALAQKDRRFFYLIKQEKVCLQLENRMLFLIVRKFEHILFGVGLSKNFMPKIIYLQL